MANQLKLTDEQKQIIINLYPTTATYLIAEKLGLTRVQVKLQANKLGVYKQDSVRNQKKVVAAWNKGLKMRESTKSKLRSTWFKKGHRSGKYKPLGYESWRRDGWFVKIGEPKKWIPKARLIWSQHFGEIPKGHKVIFVDGDRNNFAIENLMLVSCANLLMKNNKLPMQDDDIMKVRRIVRKLQNTIKQIENGTGN